MASSPLVGLVIKVFMIFRALAGLLCLAAASSTTALEKSLPLALELGPEGNKIVRLQKLVSSSTLTLRAMTSCEMQIELSRAGTGKRILRARMPRQWDLELDIATAGDYLLSLHNPSPKPCSLKGDFGTSLDTTALKTSQADLQKISRELQKVFIADDIQYLLIACDTANSFAEQSTVILCREHMEKLREYAPDNTVARNLMLFTLMHETSHVLLTQWEYPFNTNEDVVDEFAVILLQLMKKEEAVSDQAEYFDKQPALPEYRHKLDNNDRHTLSVQRARNLRSWQGDTQLLKRWLNFLLPHIQTGPLQHLQERSGDELAKKIAAELERRRP